MKKLLQKTKRGGASMFVVMFTVLILAIITLGFTRLIISEVTKTSNTDLSQSAYDSALAGIEDAKMALLQYHKCLDQGNRANSGSSNCRQIISDMQAGIRNYDCSTVQKVLKRDQESDNHAVVVQETQHSYNGGNNADMLQAYTCVTIQEDLEDYRTTLNSTSRLRIIPIRSEYIDYIDRVELKWYSRVNYEILRQSSGGGEGNKFCGSSNVASDTLALYPLGSCSGGQQAPPTLTARLIQTDEYFDISELSASKASNQTDTGQLAFLPIYGNGNNFDSSKWGESANKGENKLTQVKCDPSKTWFCTVDIKMPKTFKGSNTARSDANTYLLVSIPYGAPETDISVQVFGHKDGSDVRFNFTGVQARVDSTGRANDLYRRIETRVELVDTYYAYPEFEITMLGGSGYTLKKLFDATFNCWNAENGSKWGCGDSSEYEQYTKV